MKLSVSLPATDVAFLDAYARERGFRSRSAAVQQAIAMLRESELGDDYASAWQEWADDGAAAPWDTTSGDGLGPGR